MIDASAPRLGDVWRFPFLWSREAARGETEGRKDRPVVLALLIRNRNDEAVVLMLPITSVPQNGRFTIEVPEIEKRRAGLDRHVPLWIVADEANEDIPSLGQNAFGLVETVFARSLVGCLTSVIPFRTFRRRS